MFVVAGALLGLIALLATLQYRWLGQISDAERERMTATLNTRATAFAQDFDRELTRAYLLFQLDPMQDAGRARGARGSPRATTAGRRPRGFPRMIKEIYLSRRATATSRPLQRFNPATRFLEPADWPASHEPSFARSSAATPSAPTGTAGGRTIRRADR